MVAEHWDEVTARRATPSVLPGGAALFDAVTARSWVLIDDGQVARFGPALAWSDRQGAASLEVLVDGGEPFAAGVIARRAACFSPAPAVWSVSGRALSEAAPAEPLIEASSSAADPEAVALLEAHDLEVVSEHGVLRGEVLGLEVARTVGGRLEVGVGRHDRSARIEMRPGESLSDALSEAAGAVRSLRALGAPPHPANTLARSRWLRSVLVRSPSSIGLTALTPIAPPLPWFDLPEAGAAPALGSLPGSDSRVVVVCSVGVDLDLLPTAADCRLLYGSEAGQTDLWLVLPEGDDLPVTRSLAGCLAPPAAIHVVPRRWEKLAD